jgi:NADPH:quinone reductase-like Zn-dependent oxidoreductase
MMQAMVLERYGPPEGLVLQDLATPEPTAHQVRVRVHAASVNDWDGELMQGKPLINRLMNGLFRPRVQVIGGDIAGTVDTVSAAVTGFKRGDAVYGDLCMHGFGAFAEYLCGPVTCQVHKPATMRFEQAAAIPQAGMLAVQGLIDTGLLQPGQNVLLNGAGGGVGTFARQRAKLQGVELTAVDRAGTLPLLQALGADHVIDFETQDFTRAGPSYDLILDTRTKPLPRCLSASPETRGPLRDRGRPTTSPAARGRPGALDQVVATPASAVGGPEAQQGPGPN